MDVAKDALEAALPVFKELNLTQEQAQGLVDLQTAGITKSAENQATAFTDMVTGFETTAKADKEIGGDSFTENVSKAQKVLGQFGSEALSEQLNVSGLGSHVEVIRLLVNVSKAMGEDSIQLGNAANESTVPLAESLYSKSDMNP